MNSELTIVHIDDHENENTALLDACERDLQIPADHVLWRRSRNGGLDLFQELARQQKRVAGVVCNGEIFTNEDATSRGDLNKFGGLQTFAHYQDLMQDEQSVRTLNGTPGWVHHTMNWPMSPILENWNQHSPAGDAMGGVTKFVTKNRALSAALAIVMHVRGVLPLEDPRVAQAIADIQADFRLEVDDMELKIGFSPPVHDHMRVKLSEAWPYRPEHRF